MKRPDVDHILGGEKSIALLPDEIQAFARWSGDCNPLHVDAQAAKQSSFGQPIAHGILALLKAVQSAGLNVDRQIKSISAEFRGAVVPNASYEVALSDEGASGTVTLLDGTRKLLIISLGFDSNDFGSRDKPAPSSNHAFLWEPNVPQRRQFPVIRTPAELGRGIEIVGHYAVDGVSELFADGPFTGTQLTTLALCSYVVGMEIPGLNSLFTRLELVFSEGAGVDLAELQYCWRTTRYEQHLRILDSQVEVMDASGTLVASGSIRSYLRLPGRSTPPSLLKPHLSPATKRLNKKVVLICGGSRGLGADMTSAFALAGARVYVASRSLSEDSKQLMDQLAALNHEVTHLSGDVGDDSWCADAALRIKNEQGRLDVLVLNACAPPEARVFGSGSTSNQFEEYVVQNLRLVHAPLEATLSLLAASQGAVVAVSSSFVEEAPANFSAYVALKQAVEGLVKSAMHTHPELFGLIPRPPRLQTRWNDTPTAVASALPVGQAAVGIVNRLAESWIPGKIETQSNFPVLVGFDPESDSPGPSEPDFEIRIVSTFTAEPILPSIEYWFRQLGLNGSTQVGPYGQVLQELINPTSELASVRSGVGVLLLRIRDWLRELPDHDQLTADRVQELLRGMASEFIRVLRDFRLRGGPGLILVLCPSQIDDDPLDRTLWDDMETDIAAGLEEVTDLVIVKPQLFHGRYEVTRLYDPLRDEIGHIPYLDSYYHVLGTLVVRHLHRRLAPPRKVIVVDCDNTLWKGIVGEVGPEGVQFGPEHLALHAKLIQLSNSGVLVCLGSKNEEDDVWSVFDQRPDFSLKRDHIAAATINWEPKSENINRLASILNLGRDSFILLDDNPVECAEVRAHCPEVLTIQWPDDPIRGLQLLDHTWELDTFQTTQEDRQRRQQYQEEVQRQELQQGAASFRDYIEGLNLHADIRPLDSQDLSRASQLTLRTNQFNFTTRRRQESELQQLMVDPSYDCRTLRVRDRFGDYGLVGLIILHQQDSRLELDTFLLSCRVMGRGVEYRMAASIGAIAERTSCHTVRMCVESTKRNTPARKFLQSIAAPGTLKLTPEVASCDFPATELAQVVFEPDEVVAETQTVEVATENRPATDPALLRVREAQIAHTAFELGNGDALDRAIKGRPQTHPVERKSDVRRKDIAADVIGAFADALRMSPDAVAAADSLESLGCDSFKIVEITVALAGLFPWLPSTLLFEHSSVSSIIDHIQLIVQKGDEAPAAETKKRVRLPSATTDIAVVGMHVRCAGANNPAELWELLSGGNSAVEPVPLQRESFLTDLSDSTPYWAGLLPSANEFDAAFFGIAPNEARYMDPQQRLFLEAAYAALEDAGDAGARLDPTTGVFVGVMYGDYRNYANATLVNSDQAYRCWESFSIANRLSQFLGIHGPSYAIDTACSSSGTALHAACLSLLHGDCTTAIVGGINLILDPNRFSQLGRLGILSPTGKCRAFGDEANGTLLGEGIGVVVLKPLEKALTQGDHIYGVIKGSGLSVGAGSVGFTVPNPQAQAEAIRRSLEVSGIDPRTVSYVETHGTGTALGDPIEVRGLNLAYGDRKLWNEDIAGDAHCAIGSIKPNIGHLEAGAFIVGLIKILLQFSHKQLAPSLTSDHPNPQIPFGEGPFYVQRTLEPWKPLTLDVAGQRQTLPRRAGLSSFGVGGANIHVILEEPPAQPRQAGTLARPSQILALSAEREDTLIQLVSNMRQHLNSEQSCDLGDFCYSVNTGYRHLSQRCIFRSNDHATLLRQLQEVEQGGTPAGYFRGKSKGKRLAKAFLFTGQGAQFNGMGRQLFESQPVFRQGLEECAALLASQLAHPLLDVLFAPEESEIGAVLHQTAFTQPALFSIQYALAKLWKSWGVSPSVIVGHSVGEFAGLVVAGGMALEDGLKLIAARGRLMQALPSGGAMCSFRASAEQVREALQGLEGRASIAAINGPSATVVSGELQAVNDLQERLSLAGIKATRLQVSHAFHSHLMEPMLREYERVVAQIPFRRPQIPFISSVTGNVVEDETTQVDYWLQQVRQPVNFLGAMQRLAECAPDAYLEIGPQPVLVGMGRTCIHDPQKLWLPSLQKSADDWATLEASLGQLYVAGDEIDWEGFYEPYGQQRISLLPTYPFQRRKYWLDSPVKASAPPNREVERERPKTSDLIYHIEWRPAHREPGIPALTHSDPWLILTDRDGIGRNLGQYLAQHGIEHEVVEIAAEQAEGCQHFDEFYRSIFAAHSGKGPVIWLRGLDLARRGADESQDSAQINSLGNLLADITALTRAALVSECPPQRSLWLVTSGAVSLSQQASKPSPKQAGLWGLGRVAALEYPTRWGGVIDVESTAEPALLAEQLIGEIYHADNEDQIVLRGEQRYVPRLVRNSKQSTEPLVCDPEGVYLISGGLGALGHAVANWLIRKGARHLVLTGRRGMESPDAAKTVTSLEQLGAQIQVIAADFSRSSEVDRTIAAIDAMKRPLRGVVHAAGVDLQTPISDVSDKDVASALRAKVNGGWRLHQQTTNRDLQFFICFSSIAAVWGSAGRSIYASANAYLDGLAAYRRSEGLPALSVNWGPWTQGGMSSEADLRQLANLGNYGLDPAQALDALETLWGGKLAQATVADVDWKKFLPVFEARCKRPLLSELARTSPDATESPSSDLLSSMLQATPDEQRKSLLTLICGECAATLGFDKPADVPLDRNLFELGLDSLSAVSLCTRLDQHLHLGLSAVELDQPDIPSLADFILKRMNSLRKCNAPTTVSKPPCVPVRTRKAEGSNLESLQNAVRTAAAEVLGFDDAQQLPEDRNLFDLGLDSLSAVSLATRLSQRLGIEVSAADLNKPSLQDIAKQFVDQSGPQSHTGIVEYTESIIPEILEFQRLSWPERPAELLEARFRWMVLDSARRIGTQPHGWFFQNEGTIIGQNVSQAVRCKVGDQELPTGWFVDTAVLAGHREKGVGPALLQRSKQEMSFSLSLGQTEQMREILLRLGWKEVGPLGHYAYLLNPTKVLQGKLHGAYLPVPASFVLKAFASWKGFANAPKLAGKVKWGKIDRFEESHNAIWKAMSRETVCATVRDASFLNWKYIDQPGQNFERMEVRLKGEPVGIVILKILDADSTYQYRRAVLVDLLVRPTDRSAVWAALRTATEVAKHRQADLLVTYVSCPILETELKQFGFLTRKPNRWLLVSSEGLDPATTSHLTRIENWFLTSGDSDIDRP